VEERQRLVVLAEVVVVGQGPVLRSEVQLLIQQAATVVTAPMALAAGSEPPSTARRVATALRQVLEAGAVLHQQQAMVGPVAMALPEQTWQLTPARAVVVQVAVLTQPP